MEPDFDALADPTRRLIVALLAGEAEICVCEFAAALSEVQPKVSRHLALLRAAGWLIARREGTWMHYRLAALPAWACAVVDALVAGGVPAARLRTARSRLASFAGRPRRVLASLP
jgi:ArsR family transcriptional regulator